MVQDGVLQSAQRHPRVGSECGGRGIVGGFGTLHAHGKTIYLRPEIVGGFGCLRRTVVHVEREQPALFAVDIHTVLALLHLLGQLVQPFVVAIDSHLHIAAVVGEGHAQACSHLEDKGVHKVGRVAVVGQQHPVLVLVKTK